MEETSQSDDEKSEDEDMTFFQDGVKLSVNASDDDIGDSEIEMDEGNQSEIDDALSDNDTLNDTDMGPPNQGLDEQFEVDQQFNNNRTAEPTPSTSQATGQLQINSEEQAYNYLQTNPYFGKAFKRMIKEGIAEQAGQPDCQAAGRATRQRPKNQLVITATPENQSNHIPGRILKSPSDTTIYAPGLRSRGGGGGHNEQ